jgi:hypothetical protein
MEPRAVAKLLLVGFAIVVASFVVLDPATWKQSNRDWWQGMGPVRRKLVIAALGATILQTFL